MDKIQPTASYKLIYVYSIDDEKHKGILKVGKASLDSTLSEKQLTPNHEQLNAAARARIQQNTQTPLVDYKLEYTELAVRHILLADGTDRQDDFIDDDIHDVLMNSGYRATVFRESGRDSEWFNADLNTIIAAIKAYKNGLTVIPQERAPQETVEKKLPVVKIKLRDEQAEAVRRTITTFKTENTMLWDCKMRFGKTIAAYELIKREGYKRVIVVTHRPAVEDGWGSDHDIMFAGTDHRFIDKSKANENDYDGAMDSYNDKILQDMAKQNISFVYFASIQDLRGSKVVGGKYDKNNGVYDFDWELLIVDEAHEGTKTNLGEKVLKNLIKPTTKVLSLTGTAYNLLDKYGNNVFTWTYVDEQSAKEHWGEIHPNEKNPYADLPKMNILTFDLTDKIRDSYRFVTAEQGFNFREFFRTWTGDIDQDYYNIPQGKSVDDFVYEDAVWSFLNLISKKDDDSNYPFSNDEYIDMFRHTFWIVPGIKEAHALGRMLKGHPVFRNFKVVDVAGEGDKEEQYDLALNKVRKAIKENERTITISCGRLTTGITVKEWTAVMMLAGSVNTQVNGYMQTIFRVQSPGMINGKRKENCYVFDFAPDRTLRVISDVHQLSAKRGKRDEQSQRAALKDFLKFCPVIAIDGTQMRYYDVPEMMRQIKHIAVDHAINSGFDDDSIYLSDAGMNRDDIDEELLRKLSDVVAPQKKGQHNKDVPMAENGMTNEERRKVEEVKKKSKKELTPEDKALLEKEKEAKKEQQKLFNLLRAVSIRLPLLFYGAEADITEIIDLDYFIKEVDAESWAEFMPTGLSKDLFRDISKYYDVDTLIGAGMRIRKMAKAADEFPPTIRVRKIVEIVSKFKNPDKETVLTPWRVVNLHLGETLGGYCFYDEGFSKELDEPRFIEKADVTENILLNENVKILELNSKSGLYPLYMANTLYNWLLSGREIDKTKEELNRLWASILQNNIFVLYKTKMARSITIRTLAGYTGMKVNTHLTKLVDERMKNLDRLSRHICNPATWGMVGDKMKFDAVVGNPPYQLEGGSGGSNDSPVYQYFAELADRLKPHYWSLIMPSRWFTAGRENLLGDFRSFMLNNPHIKMMYAFPEGRDVFPTVEIKGGICFYLVDNSYDGECSYSLIENGERVTLNRALNDFDVLIRDARLSNIVKKVVQANSNNKTIDTLISNDTPFGISSNPKSSKKNPLHVYGNESAEHNVQLFHIEKLVRKIEFVATSQIKKNDWAIDKYKVFIPGAGGSGNDPMVLGKPEFAPKHSVCSQSYLFAAFETETEAKNFIKYLKTQFLRALVSAMKISQSCPNRAYRFVPLQNFTSASDVHWDKSIAEIDSELYAKYKLLQEDVAFIKSKIKPME